MARYMRGYGQYRLGDPVVVLADQVPGDGKRILRIYYSGAVRSLEHGLKRRAPNSRLSPPAVIGAGKVNPGLRIKLVFGRRPQTKSVLGKPTVLAARQIFFGPQVALAPSRRPKATYGLGQPSIIEPALGPHGGIEVSLAPAGRRRTFSFLREAQVVSSADVFKSGRTVVLAASRRPKATYDLAGPVVLNTGGNLGWLAVQLAPSRRPQTKSLLRVPAVVSVVSQIYYGPVVHLARIKPRRVQADLRPPADTVGLEDQGQLVTWLTYSRRGRPTYKLRPPTDTVGVEDQGQVGVHLAYSRRGTAKSRLKPPTVVFLAVEIYGPEVHLTRIKHPPVLSFLRKPTDVIDQQDIGAVDVHLTYSRRGVPKSRLAPPTVVAPVVSYGPVVWLTYSRRGTPKYFLKPPTVVAQPPAYQQVLPPWLTYSRRGRPIYFLNPPTRVFPFIARPGQVFLAPQARGVPSYFLKPPTVVRLAVEIYGPETWLTRIKPRPTTTFLRAPTDVVDERDIGILRAHLAYSRRGRPQYQLTPPAVVARAPFRGIQVDLARIKPRAVIAFRQAAVVRQPFFARAIQVHLTRIKPRRTLAEIKPPTVVRIPAFGQIAVHLTRIKPSAVLTALKPPSVVGAGIAFYGPLTTLVRIRPPKVIHFLRVTLVAFRRPHGDICGFDIAASFVCSLEVPGSQVTGGTATRFGISGSSRAGSKVAGSEQAGGSASGSDRKAT